MHPTNLSQEAAGVGLEAVAAVEDEVVVQVHHAVNVQGLARQRLKRRLGPLVRARILVAQEAIEPELGEKAGRNRRRRRRKKKKKEEEERRRRRRRRKKKKKKKKKVRTEKEGKEITIISKRNRMLERTQG